MLIGEVIEHQVAKAPRNFNYTGLEISNYEIVFHANDLPPLGFKVYEITNLNSLDELEAVEGDEKYSIKNDVSSPQKINAL